MPTLNATYNSFIQRGTFYILNTIIQFTCISIISHQLSPSSRGTYILITSILPATSSALSIGLTNIIPASTKGNAHLLSDTLKITTIKVILPSLIPLPILFLWNPAIPIVIIQLFLLNTVFNIRLMLLGVLTSQGRTTIEIIFTTLSSASFLISLYFSSIQKPLDLTNCLNLLILCHLFYIILNARTIFKTLKDTNSNQNPNLKIAMGLRSAAHVILTTIKSRIDLVILSYLAPANSLGLYSTLTTVSQFSNAPTAAIGQVLLSKAATDKQNDRKLPLQTALFLSAGGLIGSITILLIGSTFWETLFGSNYTTSATIFPYYIPFVTATIASSTLSYWQSGKGFPKKLLTASSISIIITIAIGPIAYEFFKLQGLCLTMGIASLSGLAIQLHQITKK